MAAGETLLESRKFRVVRYPVEDRDGRTRRYDLVEHPGAAVLLPILDDGRIVFLSQYRFSVDETLLELPAGTLDPGESAEVCAARELTEETGYTAGRIEPLVSFLSTPGICNERMHAFTASDLKAGATAHEPGERIEVRSMAWDEALAAVGDGRITDAKTIITLLYYAQFVRGEA